MLRVADPDEPGVIDRGGELDIHRALPGAGREVLVGDVAVVLTGPDDARGEVVGLQEVQEVAPRKAIGGGEQPCRDLEAVARGDAADQRGGRGALQVHVELGLRDHQPSCSMTAGACGDGAPSPRVNAARSASAARAALASSRAWTIASGRPPGSTRSPTAATPASPTAWSTGSSSRRLPPPRSMIARPTARTSTAVTTPSRS